MCKLTVLALLLTEFTSAKDSVFWERKDGPFYSRVVLWDPVKFTELNLRLWYQQLSRALKAYRAWNAAVFVDQDDAQRELYGKVATETSYEDWLQLYNKFGRHLLPKAEILSYGNDAVLRTRDSAGTRREVVLSGNNFLRVHVDNIQFEILEIYYHPLPPHMKSSQADEAMISVYTRSSSFPSVPTARKFSLLIQRRFQQKRIVVLVRTDSYFITDGTFPIVYRFDRDSIPPSHEQYEHSRTMYCFCDRPGTPCR